MSVNTVAKIFYNKDNKNLKEDLGKIRGLTDLTLDIKEPYYSEYKGEQYYNGGTGYIQFSIKIKNKKYKFSSFIISQNIDITPDSSIAPFMENNKKFLYFSPSQSDDSILILDYMASHFGGYVIPSDCNEDDEGNAFYYEVKRNRKLLDKKFDKKLTLAEKKKRLKSKLPYTNHDNSEMFF